MNVRRVTQILILVVLAALGGWDIFAAQTEGGTISEVVRTFAYGHPIVAFALGVVVGHWFWGREPDGQGGRGG